jgi:hypothetical protein
MNGMITWAVILLMVAIGLGFNARRFAEVDDTVGEATSMLLRHYEGYQSPGASEIQSKSQGDKEIRQAGGVDHGIWRGGTSGRSAAGSWRATASIPRKSVERSDKASRIQKEMSEV